MKADKKGTVLIVDDEAANLGVLFEHLRQADFKVLAAEDGESALRGISRVIPDIALLDVKLPDIDGFELCRRLKERCKDIPVIFMTSLTDIQGRLRGLDLSAVDYITKPFYPEEVVVRVTKHLMLRNLRKSLQEKNVQLEHEIAERKRVEEELIRSKEAAEAANKAKSTFLANMSHELRTPLNAILGYAQFLQKDPAVTEHQQDRLKIIHKSGEHLLSLINDILDLSKIEAGKIELSSAQFSMTDFLNNIADMFQMRANQKGIGFRYESSPYLPKYIRGDEVRIRQILINLLGNAVKFTDKGSITFGADYRDGRVCFEVRDTGPGISPDEREKIFDPFHQTGSSMKKSEGTGLGLSISKRLTELMGGSLTVKSTPGQGSVFRAELELPSVIPEENISDVKNSSLITGYEGARRKILIVDDIYQNRFLLSDLLISLGFETSEADDGQKAVEKAAELQPDLILMDLFMPDMDGFEAVKIIRKSESEKCQVDSGKCQVLSVKEKDNLNTFHLTHNTFHITHNTLTHKQLSSPFQPERLRIIF